MKPVPLCRLDLNLNRKLDSIKEGGGVSPLSLQKGVTMKIKILAALLALIVSTSLGIPVFAQEMPDSPHRFWGTVTIGGNPPSIDMVVSVEIEGVATPWSTTTKDGKYGHDPVFLIPSDDPATTEKDGGRKDDEVIFKINGTPATTDPAGPILFEAGGSEPVNLIIGEAPPPTLTAEAGGPYSGTTGVNIALSGSAEGGTLPYTYAWDLDDDGEYDDATGRTPSHSWGTAKTYTIGLQVTDNASATDTDTATVKVTTPADEGVPYYPPEAPTIDTDLFGTEESFETTSTGKIKKTIEATSEDGMLTLTILKDTVALDKDGKRLASLETAVDESPPDPPEDAHIIGLAYDFGPVGATFDPPITFSFAYDPDEIPEGAELVVMEWDEDAGEWVELEDYTVDTEAHIVTAPISHFSKYGLFAALAPPPLAPAAFALSNLTVHPAQVEPGETVTVAVHVANTGGKSGSYTVVLKIEGVKEAEERVTVAAGSSQTVTFSVTREEADTYAVTLDGLSGSFTVVAPLIVLEPAAFSVSNLSVEPAEVPAGEEVKIDVAVTNTGGTEGSYTLVLKINGVKEAERTVTVAAGDTLNLIFLVNKEEPGSYTVEVDGLSGSFTVVAPAKTNWPLIGAIIATVLVIALFIFFRIRRKAA